MAELKWYDAYEIGVDFIDNDHKRLLNIMLDAKNAIASNNNSECIELLHELLREAKEHFSREEELLHKAKYPGLEDHKKYHQELLKQADTARRICENIVNPSPVFILLNN